MEKTLSTLSTQIGDLQKQIDILRGQQNKLCRERFSKYVENVASEVGKCFRKASGECFKIVGVPQEEYSQFYFPCFLITNDDEYPFAFDTIYYNVAECDSPLILPVGNGEKCKEITVDEFNNEMEKRFSALKEQIK